MDDDFSVEELQKAVEHLHRVPAPSSSRSTWTSASTAGSSGKAP
jgi:hypothetical protein